MKEQLHVYLFVCYVDVHADWSERQMYQHILTTCNLNSIQICFVSF